MFSLIASQAQFAVKEEGWPKSLFKSNVTQYNENYTEQVSVYSSPSPVPMSGKTSEGFLCLSQLLSLK
jgi:hypothetical protein